MADEPFAEELAQRLALLIGMIMEDEVDGALTASLGRSYGSGRIAALHTAGEDIRRLAAAAEVVLRRYGQCAPEET